MVANQNGYYDTERNEVVNIHPFSCVSVEDFQNRSILKKSLQLTPPDIWDFAIKLTEILGIEDLSPYHYFDENQIIISNVDKKSYLSSLKLADYIVVTCDSTSMISEAAMTGKPIYVAQMPAIKKNYRFKKFFELFKSLNIIKDLENSVDNWKYEKLNETKKISGYIKEQLKNYDFS